MRWRDFQAFYSDVGPLPAPGMSIDRKDNDGNYSCGKCEQCIENKWPMNVQWATRREQQTNMRSNVRITHNGETLCVSEWARRAAVPITASTLWRRLFVSQWDLDRALSTPSDQPNEQLSRKNRVRITVDGVSYFAKDWARISGLPYSRVYKDAKAQLGST
jgi:hypothetical protein